MSTEDVRGIVVTKHKAPQVAAQRRAMASAGVERVLEIDSQDSLRDAVRMACDGRVFAVQWLFLIVTSQASAKRKRDVVLGFVDDVVERGAAVWELGSGRRTSDKAQRRAMLSDAFEAVTKGRMISMRGKRGRPPMKFSPEAWKQAEIAWFDARLKTWEQVHAALPAGMSQWRAWSKFGPRTNTK